MGKDEKVNLLLVDDEEAFLDSIRRRLQIRDFNVIVAGSGTCALEIARTSAIDVAVVDLKMPGLSGGEVILRLKQEHPWLEIIILTGHGSFDPEKEDFCSAAFSFLAKPCDLETLIDVVIAAYKKTIMNKHQLSSNQMDDFLLGCESKMPGSIATKLKKMDTSLSETTKEGGI